MTDKPRGWRERLADLPSDVNRVTAVRTIGASPTDARGAIAALIPHLEMAEPLYGCEWWPVALVALKALAIDGGWSCIHCHYQPNDVGPGCPCAHAPCIHDRNGEIAKLRDELAVEKRMAEAYRALLHAFAEAAHGRVFPPIDGVMLGPVYVERLKTEYADAHYMISLGSIEVVV